MNLGFINKGLIVVFLCLFTKFLFGQSSDNKNPLTQSQIWLGGKKQYCWSQNM